MTAACHEPCVWPDDPAELDRQLAQAEAGRDTAPPPALVARVLYPENAPRPDAWISGRPAFDIPLRGDLL